MLLTIVNASDKLQTSKTSCLQQSAYPNKTLAEQKKILIEKAKQESLEELYGTLISSSTDIKNGKMVSDTIKSRAIGAVRVKGNPSFYNGKNLGEICTDVNVYITKKDLEKYSPKKVVLKHFCFNDNNVATKDIKQKAKYEAYKEMISQYKPSMKVSQKQAENFIHSFTISNDKFDFDTTSYCFDAVGTILPYELEMSSTTYKADLNIEDTTTSSTQGLIVNFYKDNSYPLKNPIYTTYINEDIDLLGKSFLNQKIKKNKAYYIQMKGFIYSPTDRYANFKLKSDVYGVEVKMNNRRVVNKYEVKAGAALKAGYNPIEILITSSNSYDIKLLEKQDDGSYIPLAISKLFAKAN
jgi:hypothetical protein